MSCHVNHQPNICRVQSAIQHGNKSWETLGTNWVVVRLVLTLRLWMETNWMCLCLKPLVWLTKSIAMLFLCGVVMSTAQLSAWGLFNLSQRPIPEGFISECSSALSSCHFLPCRLHNYSAANQLCFHFSLHNLLALFKQEQGSGFSFFFFLPTFIEILIISRKIPGSSYKNEKAGLAYIKGKQDLLTLLVYMCVIHKPLYENRRMI